MHALHGCTHGMGDHFNIDGAEWGVKIKSVPYMCRGMCCCIIALYVAPSIALYIAPFIGRRRRWFQGTIRISSRSVLILHGDARIDGLELDGALFFSPFELTVDVLDAARGLTAAALAKMVPMSTDKSIPMYVYARFCTSMPTCTSICACMHRCAGD